MNAKMTLNILEKAIQKGSTFNSVRVKIGDSSYFIRKIARTETGSYLIYVNDFERVLEMHGDTPIDAEPISKPVSTVWEQLK